MTADKLTETIRVEAIAKVLHGVTFHDGEYGARKIIAADPATPILAEAVKVLEAIANVFPPHAISNADRAGKDWGISISLNTAAMRQVSDLLSRLREVGA